MPDAGAALSLFFRSGVALCFIGHGAYGIITKAGWLPYFAVAGIGEPLAWQLMPWVGAMDIAIGFLAFVWPCRALFAWAAAWAVWTALLRPLAGQGWSEFFERAGNYGVPLAALVALGLAGGWFARLPEGWPAPAGDTRHRLAWTLRLTTVVLLLGHAGCALLLEKAALAKHYAVLGPGDPGAVMLAVGWFEVALATLVLVRPVPALLVFVAVWKLGTESLFLTSGAPAPFFEVVERGGSYLAPLALAWLAIRFPAPSSVSLAAHPA
ncbi:hypothetical protein Verru16b_01818 [Lacunisphaera limnophila]|uniref:Uncharacterized protein n=1 Tax=Lacunisphaera limnophila TaxID=1838286 RepID=A0A1D8AV29_9BACT|nr:hypothetical protein [Lacunisphaera limnophila]AOS44750.1 hypothetical protein Verru16b_01818 [Lacunisphaera limnophila]